MHEDDGIEVLRRSVVGDHRGTFNVAGDGVLLLSQAIRRAGRPSLAVPSPAVSSSARLFRRAGVVDFSPEQMRFLQLRPGRRHHPAEEDFGYVPAYTTLEAFDDFVAGRRLTRCRPESVASSSSGPRRCRSWQGDRQERSMPEATVIPLDGRDEPRAAAHGAAALQRRRRRRPAHALASADCATST